VFDVAQRRATKASQVIDCHAHIVDPHRFPYEDGPGYKPLPHEHGTPEGYVAALNHSGISHALLVQPSCYGFDNSALVDTMRRYPGRFKAIGMVPATATDAQLTSLAQAGIVGTRFNLVSYDREVFHRRETAGLLRRLRDLDWFVEVVADEAQWQHTAAVLQESGVRSLIDHFGMHLIPSNTKQPGFRAVLELGRNSNAVVKLTTPFSLGLVRSQHHLIDPFVGALLEAFGAARCVWGSDWPFLAVSDPPDLPQALACLERWVRLPEDRREICWRNPVRLFGFGKPKHV
jgi:predicted TIM-barrel fold metal-dependent hydrolase